ncbi:DUF1561 family protein [Bartonella bacilliformis]|uniref:DUF1561 family protein n=3 Tax=Bartonella bacilliformis TaxID=774 RepID=UPI003D9C26E4
MKSKLLLFLSSLLLSLHTSFAAPIPAQVLQTPTDHPYDKAIHVKVHTGYEYCYAPVFTKGEGYIYLSDCSSSNVKFARYDLFQRVAWNINDTWLCMTAPSSVTGIDGSSTADWDYLLLRPCVINDQNQRWIIKDRSFYTADGRFRVKDYKWYAYISKNEKDYYDHHLTFEMNHWTQTISPPGNLSSKTFVAWLYVNTYPPVFSLYYLQNDSSSLSTTPLPLYYNPENGHIAQYYTASGDFYCMVSQQSSSDDWNWVKWQPCTDKVPSSKDASFWDISQLDETEGLILDFQGNPLRVTQYGIYWGVPYTAKPSYIKQDTSNSPTSNFLFSADIEKWNRYVNGNLGETLSYCPAPGNKKNILQASQTRKKRQLPPEFTLSDEWTKRLWEISRSNTEEGEEIIGYCGICMLHAMQMLAELQEYHNSTPPQDGEGYFFNTQQRTDPFNSLRSRFPEIVNRLQITEQYITMPSHPGEDIYERTDRISRTIASIFLPQYLWGPSPVARTNDEMRILLQDFINTPPGTLGFVTIVVEGSTGISGHVQPILRIREQLFLIPTNIPNYNLRTFRRNIIATTNPETLLYHLSERGTLRLHSLSTIQMTQLNLPSLNLYVSQRNCTGEGDHRRGNRELPRVSIINQCLSGRCAIQ